MVAVMVVEEAWRRGRDRVRLSHEDMPQGLQFFGQIPEHFTIKYSVMIPQSNWTLFGHASARFVSLTDRRRGRRDAGVFLARFTLFLVAPRHVPGRA